MLSIALHVQPTVQHHRTNLLLLVQLDAWHACCRRKARHLPCRRSFCRNYSAGPPGCAPHSPHCCGALSQGMTFWSRIFWNSRPNISSLSMLMAWKPVRRSLLVVENQSPGDVTRVQVGARVGSWLGTGVGQVRSLQRINYSQRCQRCPRRPPLLPLSQQHGRRGASQPGTKQSKRAWEVEHKGHEGPGGQLLVGRVLHPRANQGSSGMRRDGATILRQRRQPGVRLNAAAAKQAATWQQAQPERAFQAAAGQNSPWAGQHQRSPYFGCNYRPPAGRACPPGAARPRPCPP